MEGASCRACGNRAYNTTLVAREMMFGRRDSFEYVRCAACGALSLVTIPDDLSVYYPREYYSFATPAVERRRPLVTAARRARAAVVLRMPSAIVGRLVAGGRAPVLYGWVAGLRLAPMARIVDVGSGSGSLLADFARQGFTRLLGVDPYLEHETSSGPVSLRRLAIDQLTGRWDLLMFNHSLEHVPDPLATLRAARQRLAPGGAIIVRVPLADGCAARHYGENWIGVDAPRHLMVPTHDTMKILASRAGLHIKRVFYDTHSQHFWGSEQYRQDIPLLDERSYCVNPGRSIFRPAEIAHWEARCRVLNRHGGADAGGFVLTAAATRGVRSGTAAAP